MKQRIASTSGALASAVLILLGCSGASFTSSSDGGSSAAGDGSGAKGGRSSGGVSGSATAGSDAMGGDATGGSASGGTHSGGTQSGGNASGGVTTGGSAVGGAPTGGTASGGMPNGGASTGGTGGSVSTCESDSDCVDCAYSKAPATPADCYCTNCAVTPMTKAACASNQSDFEKVCRDVHLLCPAIACVVPPKPVCKSHMCVAP